MHACSNVHTFSREKRWSWKKTSAHTWSWRAVLQRVKFLQFVRNVLQCVQPRNALHCVQLMSCFAVRAADDLFCIVCCWRIVGSVWNVLQCVQLTKCFALCAADELLVVCEMFCSVCSWQNVLHCVQLTTCFALCATGECLGLCAAHDLFKLHCVQLTEWFCCMCRLRNAFQCAADKWFCSACSLQNI